MGRIIAPYQAEREAAKRWACRIRLLRVMDAEGRCEKADVYVVLRKDWRGDAILDDIRMNMRGIQVVPWDFDPDGPKVYAPRSGSAAEGVIGLMRDGNPGPVLLAGAVVDQAADGTSEGRLGESDEQDSHRSA